MQRKRGRMGHAHRDTFERRCNRTVRQQIQEPKGLGVYLQFWQAYRLVSSLTTFRHEKFHDQLRMDKTNVSASVEVGHKAQILK